MPSKTREEFEKWYIKNMDKVRQGLKQENDPVKDIAWAAWKSRDEEIKKLQAALLRYTGLVKEYDLDDDGELLLEMESFCRNEIEKESE